MRRRVLITGIGGGIGSATSEVFAENGWLVLGIDRKYIGISECPSAEELHIADVSEEAEVKGVLDIIENDFGWIDAIINNAAIQVCKPILSTFPEEWDAVMGSNLKSAFYMTIHGYSLLRKRWDLIHGGFGPTTRSQGGSIVNISSVHAINTSKGVAAYAASKGGLVAFTRATAIELAEDGIRVNAVLPGATDTSMLREHLTDEDLELLASKTVIGRVAQPREIAEAILFLADNNRSSFITGASLVVDGGATIRLSTE